jgi:hypothetical protein
MNNTPMKERQYSIAPQKKKERGVSRICSKYTVISLGRVREPE